MDLRQLIPGMSVSDLGALLIDSQWNVQHGSIGRFPEFLRPDDGALSNIGKLGHWGRFDVGYRDGGGQYHQVKSTGDSAATYYDKGALVNSRSIEEVSPAAQAWLAELAAVLGISREFLRLNSWAVRGASGIDWHFDYEDVVHFQIKGDKRFKFLSTPQTRFADRQTKVFERVLAAEQNFAEASEEVVGAGTITIIPRGVWHWSEGKSGESFAVSLCISTPSCAQTLVQALSKRLRLVERHRAPLFGFVDAQCDAMDACVKEAGAFLRAMKSSSVLAQECRLELPLDEIESVHFYIGNRANARRNPLRMLVDGKVLAVPGGAENTAVLDAVCKIGQGFLAQDLRKLVPQVEVSSVNETLSFLIRSGFLEFVDASLDAGRNLTCPPLLT